MNKSSMKKLQKHKQIKYAGIDIGERNIMAVFIDDETTKSLLIESKPFKDYNEKINKIIEYLNEAKSKESLDLKISKTDKDTVKYTERTKEIDKLISFLNSGRKSFFHEQFHKNAKYVVEYLHWYGVTHLFISKNLANHKFIQIKFKKLLGQIEHEAQGYGIKVDNNIDESFTSQVSCITGDIKSAQKNPNLTHAFNGKRSVHRTMFFDTVINERFYADLNAAVNHIKVGTGKNFEWLKDKLFKLKDPIKITSDQDFEKLLASLKKSNTSKPPD